jgi:hypothetical protein
MRRWDIIIVVAIMFTALVTPFEIALLDPAEFNDISSWDALFVMNRGVDVVFISDLFIQFFLAYQTTNSHGKRRKREKELSKFPCLIWSCNSNILQTAHNSCLLFCLLACLLASTSSHCAHDKLSLFLASFFRS